MMTIDSNSGDTAFLESLADHFAAPGMNGRRMSEELAFEIAVRLRAIAERTGVPA